MDLSMSKTDKGSSRNQVSLVEVRGLLDLVSRYVWADPSVHRDPAFAHWWVGVMLQRVVSAASRVPSEERQRYFKQWLEHGRNAHRMILLGRRWPHLHKAQRFAILRLSGAA